MAMEARCYRGGYNRTKMRQSIITKSDYIARLYTDNIFGYNYNY